jgi:hypothetical protein
VLALLAVGLATAIGIGAATGGPASDAPSSRALPSGAAPIPATAEAVRAGIVPATTLIDP